MALMLPITINTLANKTNVSTNFFISRKNLISKVVIKRYHQTDICQFFDKQAYFNYLDNTNFP